MRKLLARLKRIRLVYRRSSTLTKAALMSAIVLSMAALFALNIAIRSVRAQTEADRNQAAQLEQENAELEDKINDLGSADSVEQIAQEELGLVDGDTVVITPEG